MSAVALSTYTDIVVNHSEKHPKDLFNVITRSLQWTLQTGLVASSCIKNAAGVFASSYNTFCVIDLLGNANNLFKHYWADKPVENITDEIADGISSTTETILWVTSSKIFTLGTFVLRYVTGTGAVAMTFFFAKKTISTLDFLNKHADNLNKSALDFQFFSLTKTIALCALGILLASAAFLNVAVSSTVILGLSTASLIADLGRNYIQDTNSIG